MALVYLATFPNGKTYVGFDKSNRFRRKYQHMSDARNNRYPNLAFHNAIRKYGEPVWSLLAENLSESEALKLEAEFIHRFDSLVKGNGYNVSAGGGSGFLGAEHSLESRAKTSKAVIESFKNPAVKARHKAAVNSTEHRQRQRESLAKYYENGGKEKARNAAKNKKPIRCKETGLEYESINSAARELAVFKQNIIKVLKGIVKQTGGYSFEYVEQEHG